MGLAEQACMQAMGALAGEEGGEMTGLFAGGHTSTWHPSMYRQAKPWWNQVHTGAPWWNQIHHSGGARPWWDQYHSGAAGGWQVVETRFVPTDVKWELSHASDTRVWDDGHLRHEEGMVTMLDERRWRRQKTYDPSGGTLSETYTVWSG